jgi:hypothetical protein
VRETPEEIDRLQRLLDRSAAAAGAHLRDIITDDRRLSAAVSATHLPGEELAVTVHGRAELFELSDPARAELRQAMLDHYLPTHGPEFETWLDQSDSVAARITADKMFTFAAAG